MDWIINMIWSVVEVLLLLLLVAVADIWRRGYSTAISWPRLILLWTLRQLGSIKTFRVYRRFERDVREFEKVQSEFLLRRIRRCENTAYGRDHGFNSVRSVEDFRRSQPVTDFSHFQTYVDRMADKGDKLAMFGEEDKIEIFTVSSGTTGKHKRIPVSSQGAVSMQKHMLYGVLPYKLHTEIAPWSLKRFVNVTGGLVPQRTKSGHFVGSVSTIGHSKMADMFRPLFATPTVTSSVKSEFESQYIHLVFALRDKHIGAIICIFIFNFLSMMRRLKFYKKDLVKDVRRGRIKEDLDIPESVRTALNAELTPMPERADEIDVELSKGLHHIVPRLWPEITRVTAIWSGSSNEIYYQEAKAMVGPNVPIISFSFLASEGLIGVNTDLKRRGVPVYTLVPDANFYEFLPVYNDQISDLEDISPKDLLLPAELKVGQTYEIFLTNASGLYRYRQGDVVRVAGFYQQAPQVEFLYRSGQNLNVNGEKLSEEVFFRALLSATSHWPTKLRDYTVAGSQFAPSHGDLLNPHYLVFVEVDDGELTDTNLAMVDSTLIEYQENYAHYRRLGKISPMKLHRVPSGTFARFKQHLLDTTPVTSLQFKMPRVLKSRDKVEWFLKNLEV